MHKLVTMAVIDLTSTKFCPDIGSSSTIYSIFIKYLLSSSVGVYSQVHACRKIPRDAWTIQDLYKSERRMLEAQPAFGIWITSVCNPTMLLLLSFRVVATATQITGWWTVPRLRWFRISLWLKIFDNNLKRSGALVCSSLISISHKLC